MGKFAPDGTTYIPWTIDADQVGGVDVDTSPNNTTTYLRADGTWATPAGTGVSSVSGSAPIASTGGTTPVISISAATTLAAGSMSAADKTKLDGLPTSAVPTSRTISTTAPLTGGGDLSADRTLAISDFAGSSPGAVPTSLGGTTNFLRADGSWSAPAGTGVTSVSGTAPISSSGGTTPAISLDANGVTDAKFRQSGALAVVGRSANSTGNVADIQATAASDAVLRESGSVLGFGTIATGGIANNAVTDAKLRQGTALTVIGRSANSTGNVADIAAVAASGAVLRESGSTIGFGTIATAGIADNAVTLAKLATQANSTVIGNVSGGVAAPSALTTTQLTTLVNVFTSLLSGAVPASGGGTSNFLRADGTWASPAAGSFVATDVTVDFGTSPLPSQVFDVADASAVTTHNVVCVISGTMPAGVDFDELEMDPLTVVGMVPTNGTVRFRVSPTSPFSMIVGQRNINYALG